MIVADATPMSGDDLRNHAQIMLAQHNPAEQDDNPYERCALCHFTRHPCDVYDLAAAVLTLLSWQTDACGELINWGRYSLDMWTTNLKHMQPITALLERANADLPEWWNIGSE